MLTAVCGFKILLSWNKKLLICRNLSSQVVTHFENKPQTLSEHKLQEYVHRRVRASWLWILLLEHFCGSHPLPHPSDAFLLLPLSAIFRLLVCLKSVFSSDELLLLPPFSTVQRLIVPPYRKQVTHSMHSGLKHNEQLFWCILYLYTEVGCNKSVFKCLLADSIKDYEKDENPKNQVSCGSQSLVRDLLKITKWDTWSSWEERGRLSFLSFSFLVVCFKT